MPPHRRRQLAMLHLVVSICIGWPASWFIPNLEDVWFQRVMLFISFYAITITAWDVWQTSDVRTTQEDA
jgi:hypothetical protein